MSINLRILPLRTVEHYSSQKCLIPREKFSQICRPGLWAKCWFHSTACNEFKNFSICQVFPRNGDDNSVCYLDLSVCKIVLQNEDHQLILDNIEPLNENGGVMRDIRVSYVLSSETKMIDSISKSFLAEMTQLLLQEFHLSKTCVVMSPEFQRNGVEGVCIDVSEFNDQDTFTITDDVAIQINNVCLNANHSINKIVHFEASSFAKARQELDDLMHAVQIQRDSSPSKRMALNSLIVGPVGCGKSYLLEDYLHYYRCNVFRVKTNVLKQYPGETEMELRRIFKAAQHFETHFKPKEPTVIVMEDIHLLCQKPKGINTNSDAASNSMRILTQLLALVDELHNSKCAVLCLASTNDTEELNELFRRPGRFDREVRISRLSPTDRRLIVDKLFTECLPNITSESLLQLVAEQTQGYVVADLAQLVHNVTQIILTRPQDNFESTVNECLRKCKPMSVIGTDVTVCKTTETFESIGGMQLLKNSLNVSILAGLKREKSFRRFGLSIPKGVLLYGPPGCAKTTVAKCLATEANMTFIATSGAEVYSPYVGCAEKFLAKIFDTARKNSPCLIFLDEIDSLVGRRTINASSGDIQTRILSTLLTEMDGIIGSSTLNAHILVVAATNRPDMVDDALMRPGRFDKLIHVPAPDRASRRSILKLYQQRMPFADDINIDDIATRTNNYSGADICNLCNEAALKAFERNFCTNEISYEDFDCILRSSSKSSLTQNQIDWYYKFERRFL